jgi:hypothetical protein
MESGGIEMIGQVLDKSFSQGGALKMKIQTSEGPPKWYFMPSIDRDTYKEQEDDASFPQ